MEGAQMAVGKVTISSISKLNGWLWDTTCVGFGARRQTNKGVHYYVRYRHNGSQTVHSTSGAMAHLGPRTLRVTKRADCLVSSLMGSILTPKFSLAKGSPLPLTVTLSASVVRSNPTPSGRPNAICATIPYLCVAFGSRKSTGARSQRCWATSRPLPAQSVATVRDQRLVASSRGASPRACSKPIPSPAQLRPTRSAVVSECLALAHTA